MKRKASQITKEEKAPVKKAAARSVKKTKVQAEPSDGAAEGSKPNEKKVVRKKAIAVTTDDNTESGGADKPSDADGEDKADEAAEEVKKEKKKPSRAAKPGSRTEKKRPVGFQYLCVPQYYKHMTVLQCVIYLMNFAMLFRFLMFVCMLGDGV